MEDQYFYGDLNNNLLLHLLKEPEFASALACLVDSKNHSHLTVFPHDYSIEISNNDITIAIILLAGFETNEYLELKNKTNLNLITLSKIILEMCEFENMYLKYIDKEQWYISALNRGGDNMNQSIHQIKSLNMDSVSIVIS